MGRLIYSTIMSLDGYMEDADGGFDWAEPGGAAHAFINDLMRPIGTHLYGRRTYDMMRVWETLDREPGQPAVAIDFARLWQAADKVVYSRTLGGVDTARTRLERDFDAAAVRRLKAASTSDLVIGGAELAGHAITAGLVDEYHLFVTPVLVGGGKRALPDGAHFALELVDEQRFEDGMLYLMYVPR